MNDKNEMMKAFFNSETVYVLYSGVTHVPFIACNNETMDDELYLFSDEGAAVSKQAEMTAKGENVLVRKLDHKAYLAFMPECIFYGVNVLVFTGSAGVCRVPVEELIKVKTDQKAKGQSGSAQSPAQNSVLSLVCLYFLQELRKGEERADTDKLAELDEELSARLAESTLFVPVRKASGQDSRVELMVLQSTDGSAMIPVFTDPMEYDHFRKGAEQGLTGIPAKQLAQMPLSGPIRGFILNPAGCSLHIGKKELQRIVEGGCLLG